MQLTFTNFNMYKFVHPVINSISVVFLDIQAVPNQIKYFMLLGRDLKRGLNLKDVRIDHQISPKRSIYY